MLHLQRAGQRMDDNQCDESRNADALRSPITHVAVHSWNIDFMLPYANSRMAAAIEHLRSYITANTALSSTANVIMLAECTAGDLELIAADPWVRQHFSLTDVKPTSWESHYGTTMLVDTGLTIKRCFRIHYSTTGMGRDGLFVDVDLATGAADGKVLRLCTTHLESLGDNHEARSSQLVLCAQYMKAEHVAAAVLAGDLNATKASDQMLHTTSGLKDAYLELGGQEDDATGHTWGQQARTQSREMYGTSRMDKVLFFGEEAMLKTFEIFGAGIEVADPAERQGIISRGCEKAWITDHLGVKAVFELNRTIHL